MLKKLWALRPWHVKPMSDELADALRCTYAEVRMARAAIQQVADDDADRVHRRHQEIR